MTFILASIAVALAGHRRRRLTRRRLAIATSGGAAVARRPGGLARLRSRRATPPARTPIPTPLLLELLAALLESGAPPPAALRHIATALARVDDPRALPLRQLAASVEQGIIQRPDAPAPTTTRRRRRTPTPEPDAGLAALGDVVRLAAVAGLPPAALVRRGAVEERRRSSAVRRRAIRRLEVLLVLPVGLCLLPAFVLLGIVPVVIDLFGG